MLTLIESSTGLISILNEECVRPKGNDSAFVSKVNSLNKQSDCLICKRIFHQHEFGVHHYAGPVIYDANGFVSKNTDGIAPDLVECAKKSSNEILRHELDNDARLSQSAKSSKPPSRRLLRKKSSIVAETVWTKFRNQLVSLMQNLTKTRTRYIRCIKPNSAAKPFLMQHVSTVEQLRCAGVVAAVTISRSAFPNRVEHEDILKRFRSLWGKGEQRISAESINPENPGDAVRADVNRLLTPVMRELETTTKSGTPVKAFVIGKTRTYFRAGALEHLEAERLNGLGEWATTIQRGVRGLLARRLAQRIVEACIVLQCWARCNTAKTKLTRLRMSRKAATHIQAFFRMIVARGAFARYKRAKQERERLVREERKRREAKARKERELAAAAAATTAAAAAATVAAAATHGSYGQPEIVGVQQREAESLAEGNVETIELSIEGKTTEETAPNEFAPEFDLEAGDEEPEDDSFVADFETAGKEKSLGQGYGWFRRHRRALIVAALLIVTAIVGAVVGVALSGGESTNDGSYRTPPGSENLFDIVVSSSLNEGREFDDPLSYQAKAFDWLAKDPVVRSYSPERVLQRYALACAYHATYGVSTVVTDVAIGKNETLPGWTKSTHWLSDRDECTWHGVSCEQEGLVTHLELVRSCEGNRALALPITLSGSLFLALLMQSENNMTGSFPPETTYLRRGLRVLDLTRNDIWNQGEEGNAFLGSFLELRKFVRLVRLRCVGLPSDVCVLN